MVGRHLSTCQSFGMLVAAKLVVLRRSFIRGFSTKVHPPEAAAAAASTVSASTSPVIALKDRSLSSQLFSDVTTNLSPSIKRKLAAPKLFGMPHHPLSQLKREIESFLQSQHYNHFAIVDSLDNPIVTVRQNFDELLIGPDHPGRAATDTYYVNKDHVLRTHTSAHQSEVLGSKRSNAYLISADVYRRDEIDTTHYPVFHQMEGIYTFSRSNLEAETVTRTSSLSSSQTPTHFSSSSTLAKVNNNIQNIPMKSGDVQSCHTLQEAMLVGDHLKYTLEGLVRHLFSHEKNLEIRWIDAYFPFTSPSWEMEVLYQGKWLELFGCGVMRQSILDKTGRSIYEEV